MAEDQSKIAEKPILELQELYNHVDRSATEYNYPHQIANLFQKLRDEKAKASQLEEAAKAQWEIDCFNFTIQSGEVKSMYTGTDAKGQPVEYPTISRFGDKGLDYVAERLEASSNPLLRARYAHILWASHRKHSKYAKTTVDSYLKLVNIFEEKDRKEPQAHHGLRVLDSMIESSILAFKIDYRLEDIRSEIRRLVRSFNLQSSSAFVMRARLINHMLESKGNFPPDCFEEFPQICRDLAQELSKAGRFHNAIDIFVMGEKVENKLGVKKIGWNKGIAEAYERLMNQRGESDLAAITFCQSAIEYYGKIKDEEKVQEMEKKYGQLKGKQRFKRFSQEIDLKEFTKKMQKFADDLTEKEPEEIIDFLINYKELIPSLKKMEERAQKINKTAVLKSIVPVAVNDRDGHTAEHFSTEEEKNYFGILEQYNPEIQISRQILINDIFLKAIQKDNLNINTTMEFLEKHSWYGKNIKRKMPNNQTIVYNWLNLLAPGLNEYFNQMSVHLLEPEYVPNFVLAMDSLTLKIEGLIRDICNFSGITTFYQIKDKQGRNIVREKDLNWLLREEPMKKLFNEDDLLFFKYVLVEKAGMNLRHKIAHCLIDYSEYNFAYMNLLLVVLLRLGRYDFVKSEETIQEKIADAEQ